MNKGIKERTIEFVKSKGMSMKGFEQKCNLSSGYVTSMRKGFGIEKLNNVLTAFPDLNRDWLLYGEGEMIKSTADLMQETAPEESTESILATLALGMQEERRRHDEHISNLLAQQERLIALLEKSNVREKEAAECAAAAS